MAGTKLLPCPFCGGEAKAYVRDYGDTHYWRVSCSSDKCGVNPVTNVYHTEAGAIAAWNTRAEMGYEDVQILLDELGITERTCRIVKTWSDSDYVDGWRYRCSECGCFIPVNERDPETGDVISAANYCPNCGARVTPKNSETTPKVVSDAYE